MSPVGEEKHLTALGRDRLAAGALESVEIVELLSHLARGCERCAALVAPLLRRSLLRAESTGAVDRYELPVARAFAAARTGARDLAGARYLAYLELGRILSESDPEQSLDGLPPAGVSLPAWQWAWCEALIEAAQEQPHGNPDDAIDLAELALRLTGALAQGPYPPAALADLQARAHMVYGNRLRVRDDLAGAVEELTEALRKLERGTGNPLLGARLADLMGSLYRAQRRFPEALGSLAAAERLYRRCGEPHLAGRVLVNRAATLLVAGQSEEAIATVDKAILWIDLEREPTLMVGAVQNLLLALVDVGRVDEAWRILWRTRRLYHELGSTVDRIKLLTLEARVAAAQGRLAQAERLFLTAKAGYEQHDLRYIGAIESLHLAAVLLEQGRASEVLPLVDEALLTFGCLRIEREALAAVILLRTAVAQGEATAALAREVAQKLRRLEFREPRR